MLIKIKKHLEKNFLGKIIIKIYHYLIAIPKLNYYNIKYYLIKKQFKKITFYKDEEVFEKLANQKMSISRFGDGEISWIYQKSQGYFGQENSKELSDSLKKVLMSNDQEILIAIPNFFENNNEYDRKRKKTRNAHLAQYGKKWMKFIDENKVYADSLITRVYYGNPNKNHEIIFEKWKNVWKNKDVIIIEGNETRFGIGNDLLDGAKSIKRIIAPAENAYSKYSQILAAAMKQNQDNMFLVALGPTATVMSYELAKSGRQAIDIGHLDIEYEWYKIKATKKTAIPGKYINEVNGSYSEEIKSDILKKYEEQIIERCI